MNHGHARRQRVLQAVLKRIAEMGDMEIRLSRHTVVHVMRGAGFEDSSYSLSADFYEMPASILEPIVNDGVTV